jgi:hypothetical protein
MEKIIKQFLKLKLDLSHFFNVSFYTNGEVRLIGYYNLEVVKHLELLGFLRTEEFIKDDQYFFHYEKEEIKIHLAIK